MDPIGVCKIRQRGEMENTKGIEVETKHHQLEIGRDGLNYSFTLQKVISSRKHIGWK